MSTLMMLLAAAGDSGFSFNHVISADATNYNLRAAAIAAGWDQVVPLMASVTINSGIVVSSNNTSIPAFDTGSGFPAGSELSIVNNGHICGMGGVGGAGVNGSSNIGSPGGAALSVGYACVVDNVGVIAGGGGGGGGGLFAGPGGGGQSGRVPTGGTTPGTFDAAGGNGGAWGNPGAGVAIGGGSGGAGGGAVIGNSYVTWLATGTRHGAIT